MTLKQFLFEGAAAGTTATAANTGALALNKGGGTSTFTAAAASNGSCGLELVTSATGQYNIGRFAANSPNSKMVFSGVFSYLGSGTSNAPTTTAVIGALVNGTDRIVQIYLTAANQLAIYDSTASIAAARPVLTPGTKYRIEIVLDIAAGSVTANLYTATGTTPIATWSKTSGAAFGTPTQAAQAEVGMISANQAMTLRWDDIQLNDGGTSEIGPYNASSNPLTGSYSQASTGGATAYFPYTATWVLTASGGTGTGRLFTLDCGDGTVLGPQSSGSFSHVYNAAGNYSPGASVSEP